MNNYLRMVFRKNVILKIFNFINNFLIMVSVFSQHRKLEKTQGRDSPRLKPTLLSLSKCKTLLEEKTVIVELGESQPWNLLKNSV